jgi:ABC-type amino acid transport substrate-binding protein
VAHAADTSLAQIQAKGRLVVGVDIPYGIMEFVDDAGNLVGIDMDLGRALANSSMP